MSSLAETRGRTRTARHPHGTWRARSEALTAARGLAEAAWQQQIAGLTAERDALQRALADAAQVQRRLGGPRLFRRGDFEIAGESFPAQYVSGDLLTVFEVGGQTMFAIGDICGKGLFAGMWFTHLSGLIRSFAQTCSEPAQIAERINSHLTALPPEPPLATLFLGLLNPHSGQLTYCNAGHPAPLWLRADGQVEMLFAGGPLLGAVAGAAFSNGQICLAPGETLIGYSDGVVECRNRNGQDFDALRLAAAAAGAPCSAGAILFSVLGATQDFAAAQPRADDIALLVVHRLTPAARAVS
ncbi:MAG: PP2C family protein-serine/threonine phosphatase [Chlamydiota bacterium]